MKKITVVFLVLLLVLAPCVIAHAEFTVNLRADPISGGTVSGGGTFDTGEAVDILATPAEGYTFVGWYRYGDTEPFTTSPSYTYELGADRNYIARFERALTVSVVAQPSEGGSVSQSGDGTYIQDESVTVTATPTQNYLFLGWFDGAAAAEPVSTDPEYTFNVTDSVSLIAKFSPQYTLHVNISPEDTGTVAGNGQYEGGSIITLQAIPYDDYRFTGWVLPSAPNEVISTDATYTFNLDSDLTLTATFGRSYGYIWLRVGIVAGIAAVVVLAVLYFVRKRGVPQRAASHAHASGSAGSSAPSAKPKRKKKWRWKFRNKKPAPPKGPTS